MAFNERTTYPWTFNEEQLFVAFFRTLHSTYPQASHHEILGLIGQYIPDRTVSTCKSGRRSELKYLINGVSWGEIDHERISRAMPKLWTSEEQQKLKDCRNDGKSWKELSGEIGTHEEVDCRTYLIINYWTTFEKIFENGGINLDELTRQDDLRKQIGEDFTPTENTKRSVEADDAALQEQATDPTPEEITRAIEEDENVADLRDTEFWDAAYLTDDVYVANALRLHEVTEALN
ncbi:hypothetical protein OEA41_006894 [Lepraria neglecta]|uniref:Uncharacterized protein n=1 Tax=Lepraria neglecta TaxID=209136 RepID=A0AAE0DNG9_9LECA|nr:hypothetical protein OEA41_006894 [Lepraria neglecta]